LAHIEPIAGYKIHQSIKLTFCSPKYNMFTNGLVKINPATFDKRKDRGLYRVITSKLESKEVIYYFLANSLKGNHYSIENFQDEGMTNFKEFIKRKESLSYVFRDELYNASLNIDSGEELYTTLNDNPPLIVTYYLGGILSLETICLIQLCCFDILSIPYYDYVWNQKKDFIRRYIMFIENGFLPHKKEVIQKTYNKIFIQ